MSDLQRAAALLQSPDAAGLLLAALTGDPGAELPGFRADLTTWQYRPGAEVSAGFDVTYCDPSGATVTDPLFVTTAPVGGGGGATVTRDGLTFVCWRHPADPWLPGLAPACDPRVVMNWLGAAPASFDLTLLGYRPLRRAVLRATADDDVAYLKVLRPERADRLAVRQELLAAAGLTPPLASRPAPGVLITPRAPGRPLSAVLADPGHALPTPDALIDLLDRLPAGLAELPRRPAWADRLDFHAATATDRLPEAADQLAELAGALQTILQDAPVGPIVATHGDFYEANLLVDDGRLALIDLDASGPGLREDDLACLLAHLAVLPHLSPGHYGAVPAVVEEWTADFARRVHPAALYARVAAVILSLIAGGTPGQAEHRLALAQEWARRSMREP